MTGKVSHAKLDHSQVEMKGSSKDERKETRMNSNEVCPESGFKSSMQSPTYSVLSDKNLTVSIETLCMTGFGKPAILPQILSTLFACCT